MKEISKTCQSSIDNMLLGLLLFSIASFCTALEWFIVPPEDAGGVSDNFTQIHARLDGSLSDKVLSKSDINVKEQKATSEEGRGGREPKQFKLPSFSSLTKSDSRLAPSGTFCKFIIYLKCWSKICIALF